MHPLPQDVTREATPAIVKKIRCEARESLAEELLNQLRKDSRNIELVAPFASGKRDVSEFVALYLRDPGIVDKVSQARINRYGASTIGYRFQLTMTENNDNAVNATFEDPFTRGLFKLNLKGGIPPAQESEKLHIHGQLQGPSW